MVVGWEVWAVLTGLILLFEGRALFSGRIGDTLSETIWFLRARMWGRLFVMPLWFWMSYHFFFEPRGLNPQEGVWWDDYLVILIALLAAVFKDYQEYHDITYEDQTEQNKERTPS